eukprot:m.17538 g.17538  ORF g.17538 m.17538 type:complete len:232 (+) comp3252_c0_seq1:66-761(+)
MRIHQLNNVARALDFLVKDYGVVLVNIGASDVVDFHRDIVLGLIWTLIQKFELRLSRSELLHWAQDHVAARSSMQITNLTTDWNSGAALRALVASCAGMPEPGPASYSPAEEIAEAMQLAKLHLNVDPLIEPDDLANPSVDEQSVMAYLGAINAQHPAGPPEPERSPAFLQGMHVEVVRGPWSEIDHIEPAEATNQHELLYRPFDGRGGYEVRIYWKGALISGMPIMVGST